MLICPFAPGLLPLFTIDSVATTPSPRAHPLSRTKFTPAELNNLATPRARRAAAALSVLRGFSRWDDQGQVLQNTTSEIFNVGTKDYDGRRELQSSCQPSSNLVARKDPLDSPSDSSSFPGTSLPPSYVSPCWRRPPTSSPPGKRSRDGCRSGACHSSSSGGTAAIPTSISPSESVDNAFRVDNAMHHPLTRGVKTGSVISVPEALGLAFGTPMEMCVAVPNEQRTCECILSS